VDSAARVLVIHTQEDWEIARECWDISRRWFGGLNRSPFVHLNDTMYVDWQAESDRPSSIHNQYERQQ
jgi:hypothetical protein